MADYLREYGVATTINFKLFEVDGVDELERGRLARLVQRALEVARLAARAGGLVHHVEEKAQLVREHELRLRERAEAVRTPAPTQHQPRPRGGA